MKRKREEGCMQLCVIILYEEEERGRMCAAMCDYMERRRQKGCVYNICVCQQWEEERGWMCAAICDYTL
jgi:hypothetical protein